MPTRKGKDKLSKSDKKMLKRMDKDIKTNAKIDAIKGKTKKTKRKRVIKKVAADGTKIKIKLKKGGGIKKTVTRKGGKRRVVKKKRDSRKSMANKIRNVRDKNTSPPKDKKKKKKLYTIKLVKPPPPLKPPKPFPPIKPMKPPRI